MFLNLFEGEAPDTRADVCEETRSIQEELERNIAEQWQLVVPSRSVEARSSAVDQWTTSYFKILSALCASLSPLQRLMSSKHASN